MEKVLNVVNQYVARSGLDYVTAEFVAPKGVGGYGYIMTYNHQTKTIYVYTDNVKKAALAEGMPVEKYTAIIIAHEIGHAADRKLAWNEKERAFYNDILMDSTATVDGRLYALKKIEDLLMINEIRAWAGGRILIEDEYLEDYALIEKKTMAHYIKIITDARQELKDLRPFNKHILVPIRNKWNALRVSIAMKLR